MENNNVEQKIIKTFVCNEDSIEIKYCDNTTTTLNYNKENINEVIDEVFYQIENSLDYWKKYQITFCDIGLISFFVFLTSPVMSSLNTYSYNKIMAIVGILSGFLSTIPMASALILDVPITSLKKHKIYLEMLSENKEALQKGYPALNTSDLDYYYSLDSLKKIKASLEAVNESIKLEKQIKENRPTRTLNF